MAEPYLERLSEMIGRLELHSAYGVRLESKHFFSGAALYANGKICASLSPAGLALKLPADMRRSLIQGGEGRPFRFFPKGPIKREYVALSESTVRDDERVQELVRASVNYVLGLPGLDAPAGE